MATAASQYKQLLRGEAVSDDSQDNKKWRIPDQIIRFMSNIPRTIESKALHDTKWLVRHAWCFFELKMNIDNDDIKLGQPLQEFPDFLLDTMLQQCERRIDAESYLFLLLKSLQTSLAKKKNPLLHTFARFLGVFGPTVDDDEIEVVSIDSHDNSERKSLNNHRSSGINKNRKTVNRGSHVTVDNTHMKAPSSNLSREILDVYLFSRNCLLKPYTGIYAEGIEQVKINSTGFANLRKNQLKLEGSSEDQCHGWGICIPSHVLVSDNLSSWIPLDRAVEVASAVLGFLSEKQMLALNRQIEHEAMFLNKQGILEEPEGNHSVIRSVVRKLLKHVGEEKSEDGDYNKDKVIVVNMDRILQA